MHGPLNATNMTIFASALTINASTQLQYDSHSLQGNLPRFYLD